MPGLSCSTSRAIDFAIMLPTLASLIEERMRDDPDLCAAAIHALNTWMLDAWPYVYKDRIFSTPIITPGVLDKAIDELDFLVDHGAKAIIRVPLRPGATRDRVQLRPGGV